jgi:hypothetical protein
MKYLNYLVEFIICSTASIIVFTTYYYLNDLEQVSNKSQIIFLFMFLLPIGTQIGILISKRILFGDSGKFFLFSLISIIIQILCVVLLFTNLDSGIEISPSTIVLIIIISGFLGFNIPQLLFNNEKNKK